MSSWQWSEDPDPEATLPIERASAARGVRVRQHGGVLVRLSEEDLPNPPDYGLCAAPHLGWRRFRVVVVESGERTPAFTHLESQAFPVTDGQGDAVAGRRATAEGARQFGLDLLEDAREQLHESDKG